MALATTGGSDHGGNLADFFVEMERVARGCVSGRGAAVGSPGADAPLRGTCKIKEMGAF